MATQLLNTDMLFQVYSTSPDTFTGMQHLATQPLAQFGWTTLVVMAQRRTSVTVVSLAGESPAVLTTRMLVLCVQVCKLPVLLFLRSDYVYTIWIQGAEMGWGCRRGTLKSGGTGFPHFSQLSEATILSSFIH